MLCRWEDKQVARPFWSGIQYVYMYVTVHAHDTPRFISFFYFAQVKTSWSERKEKLLTRCELNIELISNDLKLMKLEFMYVCCTALEHTVNTAIFNTHSDAQQNWELSFT